MHEVKVYDSSGKLKKVISVKALTARSTKQLETPSVFRNNKRAGKPWAKSPKTQLKTETP